MLMQYEDADRLHTLVVWNSRDGVTPFVIGHPKHPGVELSHVRWAEDRYAPDFVPPVGSYIFVDLTPERARELAVAQVEHWWDNDLFPMSSMFADKATAVDYFAAEFMAPPPGVEVPDGESVGHPDLIEVTPEVVERFAARRAGGAGL